MSSDEEIKTAVNTAINIRHESADAVELDTLLRLVRGQERLIPLDDLPLNQVAGKVTDLLLMGRRDLLEMPHRPQLRAQVRSAFTVFPEIEAPPPDDVTEALVNVTIGWMADHLPIPPMGRAMLVRHIVGGYLLGS